MNATVEDVKDMLVADSSLNLTFGTDLFIGREPSKPDDCVTIYEVPGFPPQLNINPKEQYYYPVVQARIRATDFLTGWKAANDIMVSLHGQAGETWNGTVYTVIYCTGAPTQLDWDENNRVHFIINFNLQRR